LYDHLKTLDEMIKLSKEILEKINKWKI
jgi:hypothetical protein